MSAEIVVSTFALKVIIDSTWQVACREMARGGSVGLTARQREAEDVPHEPHTDRCEKDSVSGVTSEPLSDGSAVGEERLPRGVEPTAIAVAPLCSAIVKLRDETSRQTSYGSAQRRAYNKILDLLHEARA